MEHGDGQNKRPTSCPPSSPTLSGCQLTPCILEFAFSSYTLVFQAGCRLHAAHGTALERQTVGEQLVHVGHR